MHVDFNAGGSLSQFLVYYCCCELFFYFLHLGDDVWLLGCLLPVGGGEEEVGEGVVAVLDHQRIGLLSFLEILLDLLVYLQSLVDLHDALSGEGDFVLFAVVADVLEVADEFLAGPWGNGRRG